MTGSVLVELRPPSLPVSKLTPISFTDVAEAFSGLSFDAYRRLSLSVFKISFAGFFKMPGLSEIC